MDCFIHYSASLSAASAKNGGYQGNRKFKINLSHRIFIYEEYKKIGNTSILELDKPSKGAGAGLYFSNMSYKFFLTLYTQKFFVYRQGGTLGQPAFIFSSLKKIKNHVSSSLKKTWKFYLWLTPVPTCKSIDLHLKLQTCINQLHYFFSFVKLKNHQQQKSKLFFIVWLFELNRLVHNKPFNDILAITYWRLLDIHQ